MAEEAARKQLEAEENARQWADQLDEMKRNHEDYVAKFKAEADTDNEMLRTQIKSLMRGLNQLSQYNSLESSVKDAVVEKVRTEIATQIALNRACRKIMRSVRWCRKFCDKVKEENLNDSEQI